MLFYALPAMLIISKVAVIMLIMLMFATKML